MAKADDFRCNEHQGGSLTYIHKKDIPEKVIKLALKLAGQLNKPDSIYALDFIISNNDRVYFLEGNCGPGIDWNLDLLKNERMSKKLIRIIVKELKNRTPPPMSLR
jgi:glutathione synthase/RimK-type ligase-like ATP-grasp enzyme